MTNLPSFNSPPVVRVQLSVGLERSAITNMGVFGFYETELKKKFTMVHEHAGIEPPKETPWGEDNRIEINLGALIGREQPSAIQLHAHTSDKEWHVRIQRDWMAVSWNKGDAAYPRWNDVRSAMEDLLRRAARHFKTELTIQQADVEYYNVLPYDAAKRIIADDFDGSSLGPMESLRVHSHHQVQLGTAKGRLHLDLAPTTNDPNEFSLVLTARGRPEHQSVQSALELCDAARGEIVTGFKKVTPTEFHEEWGERQ